jgi:hypothetical protein
MMKNKKGWLRIVEAFIAVLIVASILVIIVVRMPRQSEVDVHETQRFILTQVSTNETLRAEILDETAVDKIATKNFINKHIPVYWNFTIEVCEVSNICGMPFYIDKEIYADEILITSNLTKYSPKKLKFFIWEK